MPWKVKKIRRIGPFRVPRSRSVAIVETVDLRANAARHAGRPVFGNGRRDAASAAGLEQVGGAPRRRHRAS